MAWKPDFTKANPYEGMPDDYPARVAEVFVPTAETPKSPIEDAVERGWLDPSVLIIEPEPPVPPPIVPPPEALGSPAPTGWIGDIFSFVWDLSDWFYSAYSEVSGWWWPFNYLAAPFLGIYRVLRSLLSPIAHFWAWADDVWAKVQNIFSSEGLLGLLKWWFPWLYDVGEWFYYRWQWFTTAVGSWWDSTKVTVLGWIDIAKEWALELIAATEKGLAELWDAVQWFLDNLMTFDEIIQWWKDWLGKIAAALIRWGFATLFDVAGLIASAFLEREDFWAGWQDFRGYVADFFEDPLEFLWSLFADWFVGPEE